MFSILNTSKSGMIAQQQKIELISNNVVNVNTHGYKKLDGTFSTLLYQRLDSNGIPKSTDNYQTSGSGVRMDKIIRDTSQGSLQMTGNNTDVALDGRGFFKVFNSNGEEFYTRCGAFNVDVLGRITDKEGNLVDVSYVDGVDPLNTTLKSCDISINRSGMVFNGDGEFIGKINIYDTLDESSLISKGDNKFVVDDSSMYQVQGDFYQGYLEMSNVDIGEEMSELILHQRAYQMATKGVSTADEMWSMLNNIR